jgi:carbon monoxide dehydrogenase subunit G
MSQEQAMAEKLEQKFELDAPKELVWAFITDPYQIVGCLPGASIIEKVDDRTYSGTMTVKVGPVTAGYRGKVTFERTDQAQYECNLVGFGQDVKGKGSAEMRMVSKLKSTASGKTEVAVTSHVTITGIFAQMGRGMIQTVSDDLLRQFTAQFARKLEVARAKYAEVVRAHAQNFAKLYAAKLGEIQSLSGVSISADGTNTAASPADVAKYVRAVKQIAGEVSYTSAKILLENAARKENVPLPAL